MLNFKILWKSESLFKVYIDGKRIGQGEICRSKIGFMYESESHIDFIYCDVENITNATKRKKIRYSLLEYYAV